MRRFTTEENNQLNANFALGYRGLVRNKHTFNWNGKVLHSCNEVGRKLLGMGLFRGLSESQIGDAFARRARKLNGPVRAHTNGRRKRTSPRTISTAELARLGYGPAR